MADTELTDEERSVLDAVDDRRDQNLTLLRELVEAAPVNPPGEGGDEERAAAVVRPVLEELGFDVTEYTPVEGRPNIVARLEGAGDGPTLLMNAHLDVVPVEDPEAWPSEPFEMTEIDGKLYGRGTADHKAPMVGMLGAIRAIQDAGLKLSGDLVFILDSNEERGGKHGMRHVLSEADLDPDMGVYAMTSGLTPEAADAFERQGRDNVHRANLGMQRFRVTVGGEVHHTLSARESTLATERLSRLLPHLTEYANEVADRTAPLPGRFDADLVEVEGGRRTATAEVRGFVAPSEDPEEIAAAFESFVHAAAEEEGLAEAVEIELIEEIEALETPEDHPLVQASVRAASTVRDRDPVVAGARGPTGIARIGPVLDIPMILFGFGNADLHHAEPEWIAVDDVHHTVKAYALLYLDLLGSTDT